MTSVFKPVELDWKDQKYVIQANKVFGAIAAIEEQITFMKLVNQMQDGTPPLVSIAKAFSAVLKYVNAPECEPENVYAAMFEGGDTQQRMMDSINTLLVMMVPPDAMTTKTGGASKAGKSTTRKASLKRSTKRRSATKK